MLDFHNHLIPGVDDGAANIEESRSGLQAMIADGITEIIATPHITASLALSGALDRYQNRIAEGWGELQSLVSAEFPQVPIHRGFEVMLDVPHPRLDDPLLRLAGTTFVLVEFPFMNIPPNSGYALRELVDAGLIPIIAHPERYSNMEESMRLIEEWRAAGAYLQINAGSLVGAYGPCARRIAWLLLEDGNADYLCSDYHSRGRCSIGAAKSAILERGLDSQLATLAANSERVVRGERPVSVAPFTGEPPSRWRRIFGLGNR
jgi:protein-tyrosine phosphatase